MSKESLAARDDGMDVYSAAMFAEVFERVVLQNVMPQGEKCGRAVVNHKRRGLLRKETFHERIERSLLYAVVFVAKAYPVSRERGVLGKGPVDRIGVDAPNVAAILAKVLREHSRYKVLTTPPLPCKIK